MDNVTHAVASHKIEINDSKQVLSFCDVGRHHQNVKVENRIKIIYNPAKSMLVHSIHRWIEVVTQNLWPHGMSLATDILNKYKLNKKMSPI